MTRNAETRKRIAALYVETGGAYYGLPDVDPWDEARDVLLAMARTANQPPKGAL